MLREQTNVAGTPYIESYKCYNGNCNTIMTYGSNDALNLTKYATKDPEA